MISNIKKIISDIKNNEGFSVLESIVAITVLSLAIAGSFSAVQQGLSQSIISKDEVKAFYLAQEAIEVFKNQRDDNQIGKLKNPSVSWTSGLDTCFSGKSCSVNAYYYPLVINACGTGWNACTNLKQCTDVSTCGDKYLRYGSGGNLTNFNRTVMLEKINDNEMAITVRITWTKGVIKREFKVKTLLFNWI